MEFSAGSSSSSSSSSFSWTAPRDANAELSSDESEVDRGKNGGGIDAEAERRELAAVCDFKGKTLRTLAQEKEKLEEWVEAERRKRAFDAKSDVETESMRARLEEIRAGFVTLKTLTSFKVGPAGMRSQTE